MTPAVVSARQPGVDAERPVGVAGLHMLAEPGERVLRQLIVHGPRGGLDSSLSAHEAMYISGI